MKSGLTTTAWESAKITQAVKYYEADLKHLFSINKFNLKTAMDIERTLIKLSEDYLSETK